MNIYKRPYRFLSVDPLTSSYPSWSPYPFAMNRPIDGIDLDGLEYVNSTTGEYDPYPNGAYDGDVHDDFYDTKAKNHQNHQQDLIDKGFLPSAPLVTITDERPAPAKVDPSTIQSTPNGIYFSSTSGISHYFNDNTSIANRTTYLWSGEKWDLIRSEQQQYRNKLITVDAFINALANFTVGAISLFDFGISPGTITGFRASYIATKTSSRAFFSGAGTEARALNEGFTTLSQTRAGQNLMKMTEGMPYYPAMNGQPASQAYLWWSRLSATYAKGILKGSNVNVFLNNPSPLGYGILLKSQFFNREE